MPSIGFLLDTALGYAQDILAGAYAYANSQPGWQVRFDWLCRPQDAALIDDAYLVMSSREVCRRVAGTGRPFVNLN